SSPDSFAPQQTTLPDFISAHVCASPAATETALPKLGTEASPASEASGAIETSGPASLGAPPSPAVASIAPSLAPPSAPGNIPLAISRGSAQTSETQSCP